MSTVTNYKILQYQACVNILFRSGEEKIRREWKLKLQFFEKLKNTHLLARAANKAGHQALNDSIEC